MAYEIPILKHTIVAAADLSSNQFYAVTLNTSGNVVLAGDGERAIGILQNDPESGEPCSIVSVGISKAVFGGTVTPNDNLGVDASGQLVTAAEGDWVVGVALEGGGEDEVGTVLLGSFGQEPASAG